MNEEWRCNLLKAAKWLEENEWCQQKLGSGNTHCALGAMKECAGTDSFLNAPGYDELTYFVKRVGFLHVPDFNDHPSTTKEDVINVMKKCATEGLDGWE